MRYLLTLEQMIENEYPLPSYVADVFEKSEGWVETPKPLEDITPNSETCPRIFAIDCEMVGQRRDVLHALADVV